MSIHIFVNEGGATEVETRNYNGIKVFLTLKLQCNVKLIRNSGRRIPQHYEIYSCES